MDFDFFRQAFELTGSAGSAVKSIGSAVDTVKGWMKTKGDEVPEHVRDMIVDLVSHVADAKLANAELTAKLADLQQQMIKEDEFKKLRARYYLNQLDGGDFVLTLKNEHWSPEEITHHICPDCIETGRKVILGGSNPKVLECRVCNGIFRSTRPTAHRHP